MMNDSPAVTNPFPGLRPFEPHENHLFFGRDGQSRELLRRLRRQRFVSVIGTSGSGKSSLVRAGLLPSLHGGFMVGAGEAWRVTIMRPGGNPIGNLADALSRERVLYTAAPDPFIQRAFVEATLRRGALGLGEVVRQAQLPAGENLLIIVDQFEEIFRFHKARASAHAADDAAAFIKLLLEASRQREVPIYVVITMRSDFLGDCAQFRDLPEAINDGQYLIPRMTRDQRREAISGPVAVGGAEITPRLVNRLLNDVGDNPDQLPILQHALMRMWQQWAQEGGRSGPLDLQHYEAIGGMAEALSRHADKVYDELPDERSKTVAEILFKLLTERGGDNRESRRPTRLREICAVAQASEEEVVAVIERFRREGRSFLIPPAGVPLHADRLIDIAHESLIRCWGRLQQWVDDETQSARIFRRLAETAVLYRVGEAGLWRDPDLSIALAWRERNRPPAAWGARYSLDFDEAMKFLEESWQARSAKVAERERQRRKTLRLTQAFAAVLLLGFLFSAALAAYAYQQRNEAIERSKDARRNEEHAKSAQSETRSAKERAEHNEEEAKNARDEARKSAAVADEQRQRAEEQAARASAAYREASAAFEKARAALAVANQQKLLAEEQRRLAEQRETEAKNARDDARESAEDATQAFEVANRDRLLADEQRQRAESLSYYVLKREVENNRSILFLADRIAQTAPPGEKAFWHRIKAGAMTSLKQYEPAIVDLNEALKLDGEDLTALTSRSYLYLLTKEPEKSIEDARKVVGKSPSNTAAYTNLILSLGVSGRYDEARRSLNDGIVAFTNDGVSEYSDSEISRDIVNATGQSHLVAGGNEMLTALNYERAILAAASGSDFEDALREADKRPRSVDAYLLALNWAWLHERHNQTDYGVLAAQGALWERAGFPREAARAYAKFQSAYQKNPAPRYEHLMNWVRERGAALPAHAAPAGNERPQARALAFEATLAGLAGHKDALTLFNEAAEADPANIDLLMKRAHYFYDRTDFDVARTQFDHILQLAPRNPHALLYRALSAARSQAEVPHEKIRADVRLARDINPTVVPYLFDLTQHGEQLAGILAEENPRDAIDFLERAAKYGTPAPEPYFFMAKILHDAGEHEQALERINAAIEIRGNRLEYFRLRGQVEEAVQRGRRQRTAASRPGAAPRVEPERTTARASVEAADSLLKFGDLDGALDEYGNGLKALDQVARAQGVEAVRCEVELIFGKVRDIAERRRFTDGETAEYLREMFGGLKGIESILRGELDRLSESR